MTGQQPEIAIAISNFSPERFALDASPARAM